MVSDQFKHLFTIPRNPARIPVILEELRLLWEKVPDLRLGQLITVIHPWNADLFNIEDDRTLEALKEMRSRFKL